MSRLLWFVLGGVATAVGTGIAAVMADESGEGSVCQIEEDQERIQQEAEDSERSMEIEW